MTHTLILLLGILLLGSWLVIGGSKSFWEKLRFILFVIFVYVTWRLVIGDTFSSILSDINNYIHS